MAPSPPSVPGVSEDGVLLLVVGPDEAGSRVDRLLGRALSPHFSRSYLSALLDQGTITVDESRVKPSFRVAAGARVAGELGRAADTLPRPEALDLEILHSDDAVIVVNKPTDIVIHPGSGAKTGTLVNGLLHIFPEIAVVGRAERPGIVHRLDKDTTGVMVVARTNEAARSLVNQFKAKAVEKRYTALVWGELPFDTDWIDLDLGPDPKRPQARAVVASGADGSQPASTYYEVVERFGLGTQVDVSPKTGRTHQIRVHLEHLGFPVIGDKQYGHNARVAFQRWAAAQDPKPILSRQALHARRITFTHPTTGERVTHEAPLPADMVDLIKRLKASTG